MAEGKFISLGTLGRLLASLGGAGGSQPALCPLQGRLHRPSLRLAPPHQQMCCGSSGRFHPCLQHQQVGLCPGVGTALLLLPMASSHTWAHLGSPQPSLLLSHSPPSLKSFAFPFPACSVALGTSWGSRSPGGGDSTGGARAECPLSPRSPCSPRECQSLLRRRLCRLLLQPPQVSPSWDFQPAWALSGLGTARLSHTR